MYEEYFGLKKKPFSIVPDPSFFFMSEGHKEALAHLTYGIQNEGGFVLLTGEVGTGKTTVCRRLLELMPEDVEVAYILNPNVTAPELLSTICDEFGIKYPKNTASIKALVSRISGYLLDVHGKDKRAVVIIEEAQNLKTEVLEQIRLLTNLETNQRKLLQMIMIGQPELREMLRAPQLRQLSQRITARYHLGPLRKEEVPRYVEFRLAAAGLIRGHLFPPRTMRELVRLTGGVPRLINVICDRALLGAFVQEQSLVDPKTLNKAAREVLGKGVDRPSGWASYRIAALVFLLLCVGALIAFYYGPLANKVAGTVAFIVKSRGEAPHLHDGVARERSDTGPSSPRSDAHAQESLKAGDSTPTLSSPVAQTLARPPSQNGLDTREAAYEALLKQWGLRYASRDLCDQARSRGLACLAGRGGMSDLRRMNKPAVLKLFDERGGRYYATLISLRGDTATFSIGREVRTIQLREIAGRWEGDYLLLWRRPPNYKSGLKEGASGAAVSWLADRLAAISGATRETGSREVVYNRRMAEEVKQFQLAHGIIPDGIVGTRTLIALTAVLPEGDPVLHNDKDGG
jgi:general secretion pathway protein A